MADGRSGAGLRCQLEDTLTSTGTDGDPTITLEQAKQKTATYFADALAQRHQATDEVRGQVKRSEQPAPSTRSDRSERTGRATRTAVLCLLPAAALVLSACGSGTPSMNLGQAEEKVKAYSSNALAVLPDKDTVKVAEPLVDKDACEAGALGSPQTYMPYISYDLHAIPGPKVHAVFEAVQQRLKQDGFSVTRNDGQRLDLSNDSNKFTASVVVGEPDTAPDTLYLTVIAPASSAAPAGALPRAADRQPARWGLTVGTGRHRSMRGAVSRRAPVPAVRPPRPGP